MQVIIDPDAGFCPGVVKAITRAEKALEQGHTVSCLGSIVHNEMEMARLARKGMRTIDRAEIQGADGIVLIRAHGEPPSTYQEIVDAGKEYADATCPIVLRLQRKVAEASARMARTNGIVILYAKPGHPEAIGLLGHTEGRGRLAMLVSELDLQELMGPVEVFSQTTMDPDAYTHFVRGIEEVRASATVPGELVVHNTICGFVARKKEHLRLFAASVDRVIFVAGQDSSNGKYLFSLVKEVNPFSYKISTPEELLGEWFVGAASVGVSGATSTPPWVLETVASRIRAMDGE